MDINLFTLGVVIFILILALGSVLGYAAIISAREWSTLFYLNQYGEPTEATVTKLIADNNGRGTNYSVEYRYFDGGNFHTGKQLISRKHYKQFQQQDHVTVRFSLTKPNWSRLGKSDFDNSARNLYSYVAFAGCIIFAPFIFLWIISLVGTRWYLSGQINAGKKKRLES